MSKPLISKEEIDSVNNELINANLSFGDNVDKFEKLWSSRNYKKYGVSCNSGTNALFIALKAIGAGPGWEIIVPEFTMIATAWAVSYTGAKPVFVDCLDDLTIDPDKISINKKTLAIIPTVIYGRKCSQKVYDIANDKGIYIIEDMAEGHGISPRGDISCYSFYGNKIITTGEGGMCITNSKIWADEMRSLSNMYFDKDRTMIHPKIGFNFRMTNIQATIGIKQVEKLDYILSERNRVTKLYNKLLPKEILMPKREVTWVYDINPKTPSTLKDLLSNKGVESRWFFRAMSEQPMYFNEKFSETNAYKWSKNGLCLPCYPELTDDEVKFIADIVCNYFV